MTSISFWVFAGILLVAAVLAKITSGVWSPGGFQEKLSTGIGMVHRGEVGLIFSTGLAYRNQDIKIQPKDKVEIKGPRITFEGKPAIIAKEFQQRR